MRSLAVRGVPAHNGARPCLTDVPAVRTLLSFLRVVADPANSPELYALAAAEPYALAGETIATLLAAGGRRNRTLWEALVTATTEDKFDNADLARRAGALVEDVRQAIELAADLTSGAVLYDYLRRSGMLDSLARTASETDDRELQAVARFFALVRARAALLAVDRVPFLVPHLKETEPDDEPSAGIEDDDRVAVLTVHRAKGLEFRVVFIAGLVDGRFPVRSRPPLLSLPTELLSEPSDDDSVLAEEKRLFYVAMTRARDELSLTSHALGRGGKGRRRQSIFVAEALDRPPLAELVVPSAGPDRRHRGSAVAACTRRRSRPRSPARRAGPELLAG